MYCWQKIGCAAWSLWMSLYRNHDVRYIGCAGGGSNWRYRILSEKVLYFS